MDKTLNKIRQHIAEVETLLEQFTDESVQPPVSDCEKLQELLVKLQECLAVYKHHKMERELSPNFQLHAKINEVSQVNIPEKQEERERNERPAGSGLEKEVKQYPPLSIGINDKFRFINELFKQNSAEYNIAMEQLNSLNSWHEAELYLNSLKMIYNWRDESEVLSLLYSAVKKRYL